MAINTYATLQTAVSNWLARSYDTDRVKEFIALAEVELNRELRIRQMETSADITITASTRTAALPTGYLQMRRLYLNTSPIQKLEYFTPIDYWERYIGSETGKPKGFTIEGENIVVGPSPDAAYTAKALYFQTITALSDSNTTNAFIDDFPDVLLYASLRQAWLYKGDEAEQVAYWTMQQDRALGKIERADDRDRASGAVLQMRPSHMTP